MYTVFRVAVHFHVDEARGVSSARTNVWGLAPVEGKARTHKIRLTLAINRWVTGCDVSSRYPGEL